jgi:hypothetical protein
MASYLLGSPIRFKQPYMPTTTTANIVFVVLYVKMASKVKPILDWFRKSSLLCQLLKYKT